MDMSSCSGSLSNINNQKIIIMKLCILSVVFTFITTSTFSQRGDNYIKLSDKITTETRAITGFNKIDVSEDFEVHIYFSDDEEKVEIQANENLHDLIQVEKKGQTLKISTKSYSTSYKSWSKRSGAQEKLVAYITAKKLSEIRGEEDVTIVLEDKLYADDLSINLIEDSTLNGYLEVQNLVVQLDEDSVLNIDGSAQTMDVNANEDSIIKGYNFTVGRLSIDLNEDSEAKLTVNGEIDLRAKDDSYFSYQGEAKFTRKRLTGDSEVKHW